MSTTNHFPALAVTNVGKSFPTGWRQTFTALDGVSFSVQAGEVVSLIGLNGAGKTTLLKLIAGLGRPDKGAISIFGQTADSSAARAQLGFMPENPQFYPTLTAWQFMLFAGGLYGLDQATTRTRSQQLLKEGELMSAAKRPIGNFSKGMRQRLGFAQACLAQPKLLLLDEPLDGLDPLGRQSLKEQIRVRQQEGATIILCSHILADIAEMSDKVGVIHHGKLLHYGPTVEFQGEKTLEQAFVEFVTKAK